MAEENQNIRINIDTNANQAAQDTNKLAGALDNVDNSAAQTEETYKSFKTQLREANAELQKQIQLTGESSQETIKAAKAVADLKDQMGFAKDLADTFNPDQKMKALGAATQVAGTGLQGVTAGMALFGGESEDTQKQLLKVQAAMAFADSISNLSNLGDQFKILQTVVKDTFAKIIAAKAAEKSATEAGTAAQIKQNLAVLANPYVIAAAAIGALTIGIYAWVKANGEAEKRQVQVKNSISANKIATDSLTESIDDLKKQTNASNDIEVLRARAYGATDKEIQQLIKSQKELAVSTSFTQNKEAYNNLLKANSDVHAAIRTGNEDLIAESKEAQKAAQDLYKASNESYSNAINEDIKFTLQSRIDENEKAKQAQEKANEEANKRREKQKEEAKAKIEKERQEENELAEQRGENARDEYEKLQKIISDAKKKNDDALKTENELKVEAENARFEAEKQRLIDANLSIEEITIEHQRKIAELNNEYYASEADKSKAAADKEKEIEDGKIQAKKEQQDSLNALGNQGIAAAKDLFAKNKGVQKGIILAESGVALGKLAINTVDAVGQDNKNSPLTLGMPWSGIHIGQGILGAASIISSTNKQLQALGGGGGSVSSGGSSSQTVRSAAPPSVAFQNSSENQISRSVVQAQTEQPPLQVTVLESDITKAQKNVTVLQNKNKF